MTKPLYWSPEEDAKLREMWGRYEIREIALVLAKTISGVTSRRQALKLPNRGYKQRSQARKIAKIITNGVPVAKAPIKRPKEIYMFFGDKPKTLLELDKLECRFPVQNTNMFCAGKCTDHLIYCSNHRRICFQKTPGRD